MFVVSNVSGMWRASSYKLSYIYLNACHCFHSLFYSPYSIPSLLFCLVRERISFAPPHIIYISTVLLRVKMERKQQTGQMLIALCFYVQRKIHNSLSIRFVCISCITTIVIRTVFGCLFTNLVVIVAVALAVAVIAFLHRLTICTDQTRTTTIIAVSTKCLSICTQKRWTTTNTT